MKMLCYTLTIRKGLNRRIYKYFTKKDALEDAIKFLREGYTVKVK